MPALIHREEGNGPRVHALVVGVGSYPYLNGGKKIKTQFNGGMGQLSSAPISARRFADWLLREDGYHDPDRSVGSVRLLLSEPKHAAYKHPKLGTSHQVDTATMANFKATVGEWVAELDRDRSSLGMFFFSGHGIAEGFLQWLLLEDFGAGLDPFAGALRFNDFYDALDQFAAREQIFFIDACRAYPDGFGGAFTRYGDGVVGPNPAVRHPNARRAPTFNATVLGAAAYGVPNEPSLFTDALLTALRGGAGDDAENEVWRIEANMLNRAIGFLVKRACTRRQMVSAQINSADNMNALTFGRLQEHPVVPVLAECDPDTHNPDAIFSCETQKWRHRDPEPLIRAGDRDFLVELRKQTKGPFRKTVRPPYRIFTFETS